MLKKLVNDLQLPTGLVDRIESHFSEFPDTFLFVNVHSQSLSFIKGLAVVDTFPVSTSQYGIGNRANSCMTPVGIHRVTEKIGKDAPVFTIFKNRCDTNIIWHPGMESDNNLILSRIIRLEGLEDGLNRGSGIDSFERYVYIHGTNHEDRIGTPFSHGCVSMKNKDIIMLFDKIEENAIVIIN